MQSLLALLKSGVVGMGDCPALVIPIHISSLSSNLRALWACPAHPAHKHPAATEFQLQQVFLSQCCATFPKMYVCIRIFFLSLSKRCYRGFTLQQVLASKEVSMSHAAPCNSDGGQITMQVLSSSMHSDKAEDVGGKATNIVRGLQG